MWWVEVANVEERVGQAGRHRDPRLDGAILEAALEVVAEVGYEAMTVSAVVQRAGAGKAAVYRRWQSKRDLIVAAVHQLRIKEETASANPPDCGSLRGDLLALTASSATGEQGRMLRVLRGLSSTLAVDHELADAVSSVIVEPWTAAMRVLLDRAVSRGEAASDANLEVLSSVLPSMSAHRVIVTGRAINQAYLMTLADVVLLPALGISRDTTRR